MGDHVAQNLDLAGVRIDGDDRRMAPAREGDGAGGVESLEHLQALVRDDVGDRHASRRCTAHGDGAVLDDQVLRVRLEHLGGAIEQRASIAVAAREAALPTWTALRLPAVRSAKGTLAVSPAVTFILSNGQPSRSAATSAAMVSWPWPPGVEPM